MTKTAFRLIPAYKDYLWGGEKLKQRYNKTTDTTPLAESWELSAHPDGPGIIADGAHAGMPFPEYLAAAGPEVLGTNSARFSRFPVLVKFIDAQQELSVQVHPDDAYAMRVEQEFGKTEMWYIVECAPDAELIYGFDREISREEMRQRIAENSLMDVVRKVPVKQGDVFFIEAGTLHAIGKGIVIAEIQQNSNTTYRVYDFGRKDANGNTRELHIEKSLEVTTLTPTPLAGASGAAVDCGGYTRQELCACDYFTVHKYAVREKAALHVGGDSFVHLLCTEGGGRFVSDGGTLELVCGGGIFVPAGAGECCVEGDCTFLLTRVD